MIFGPCVARTHSIEFQKRGFPHAHIIVWLDRTGKDHHFLTHELDQIICAEIPDEYLTQQFDDKENKLPFRRNPLHVAVKQFMLHGPCGEHNPTLSCMIKGYCRWNFPKEYSSATQMTEDGYPLYCQRGPEMGGNSFEKYYHGKKFTYTNAWVVPYNKYLLFKYNCHINVEYCCTVYAIKYHLKYIHKGNDQATLGVEDANNEDAEERNKVEEF